MSQLMLFSTNEGLDVSKAGPENIRLAGRFSLPFRIRTGRLFTFTLPPPDSCEIWIFNRFDIPAGTSNLEVFRQRHQQGVGYDHLWSDAFVIIHDPQLEDEHIAAVRRGEVVGLGHNAFRAMKALNEFICAYATGTNQLFGGSPLHMLSVMDFFGALRYEFSILSPPEYQFTQEDRETIIQAHPDQVVRSLGQLTGHLDDLPTERLVLLAPSIEAGREHVFYELAFKAKTEMVDEDPLVALVLACAAFEGAHAAFLRQATADTLGKASNGEELLNNLLREQGVHTLWRVTAALYLPSDLKPSEELIDRCKKGIGMRNDIMHVKTKKGGLYKIRQHTAGDLNDAYGAVMDVYRLFVDALERGQSP